MTLEERYKWLLEVAGVPPWEVLKYTSDFSEEDRNNFRKFTGNDISPNWSNRHQPVKDNFELLWECADLGKFEDQSQGIKCGIKKFPYQSLEARVSKHPEGCMILLNDGLDIISGVYLSILLRSMEFQERIGLKPYGSPLYNRSEEIELLAILFLEYTFYGKLTPQKVPQLFNHRLTIADQELFRLSAIIQYEMSSFIIAHELAHIRLGHLNKCVFEQVEVGTQKIEMVDFRWAEEMDADAFAAVLLFNPNRKRFANDKRMAEYADHNLLTEILSGIFLFFNLARSFDHYRDQMLQLNGTILPLTPSHPPAKERTEFIMDKLMEMNVIPENPLGMGIANALLAQHYFLEKEIWESIRSIIKPQQL